ncbi:hypothetical protein [Mycolicibacterium chitae]|uniref:Transmembrane protein n=1 Tax=Mycolicibacterium chitae TaxID=1792 RepID=A0A448I6L1_MYCCI|nr:hypothetical protein [Mycolicibacterium chitae]MCV7108112.1 hypothetical protein [Mycolicibacterium chitae]VEG48151.1 Uncharacterised protein [Mycolicibacterium chitae]
MPRSPFSVFAVLYTVALVLELGDNWTDPWFTGCFVAAAAVAVVTGMTRLKFLTLLIGSTAYFLLFRFPEVANHVNLMLCLNVAMIAVLGTSLVRRRGTGTDAETDTENDYAAIGPILRIGLILVYVLAGFHKLNTDYLDPEASCATSILGSVIGTMGMPVLGVPIVIPVALCAALFGYRLARRGRFARAGNSWFTATVVGLGIAGIAAVAVVLLSWRLGPVGAVISAFAAVTVIGWELVGGLLLTVPRLQAAIVAISLAMHATLALVGFVDFGALAVALLFSFVPPAYLRVLIDGGAVEIGRRTGHRVGLYAGFGFGIALLCGIDALLRRLPEIAVVSGLLFNLAVLILIWPVLAAVCGPAPRPVWGGVRILERRTPAPLYLVPVLLVLLGMTSYLGLRTAGNFSMFSNLRTEAGASNHLLLSGNPLKLWDYQDDVVWILDIDDRHGRIIHHYDEPPQGHALPVVEFRKWIHDWTRAGHRVPMTYGYRGEVHTTADIVTDPRWRTEERTPAMVLQDFRIIQPGQPNWCRW